jgi:hypothetical protein
LTLPQAIAFIAVITISRAKFQEVHWDVGRIANFRLIGNLECMVRRLDASEK